MHYRYTGMQCIISSDHMLLQNWGFIGHNEREIIFSNRIKNVVLFCRMAGSQYDLIVLLSEIVDNHLPLESCPFIAEVCELSCKTTTSK